MRTKVVPAFLCATTLLAGAHVAHAQVLLDNYGTANGYLAGFSTQSTGNYLAQLFTTGATAAGSVDVTLQVSASSPNDIQIAIYNDVAGTPGNNLSGFVNKTSVNGQNLIFSKVLTGVAPSKLDPSTKYWVVVRSATTASSNFSWYFSSNGNSATGTIPNLGDATIGTGTSSTLASFTGGGGWQATNFFTGAQSFLLRIAVAGTPIAVPTITSVTPNQISAGAASTTLTVNGTNFVPKAVVKLGGNSLTTTYASATKLTAVIPATLIATAQSYSATVTNVQADGSATSNPQTITVVNGTPTLSTVSPSTIAAGSADTTITVNGTNFLSGARVKFGTTVLATTYVSGTKLTAVVPGSLLTTPGTAAVSVTNPNATTTGSVNVTITSPVPNLDSINPWSATVGDPDTAVNIVGSNFVPGSVVKFNGTSVPTTYVSPTQLTATVPASLFATLVDYTVTVFNPTPGGGTSGGLAFGMSYPSPTITGTTPDTVTVGSGNTTVTINGTGFVKASTVTLGTTALATTYVSGTQLTVVVPTTLLATSGTYYLTVTNPAPGGGASNTAALTVGNPAPALTSVSPTTATAGAANTTITVTGSNFINGSVVKFGSTNLTTTYVSGTQLTAVVPSTLLAKAGTNNVTVTTPTPGGGTSSAVVFTVNNPVPTLTSVSPTQATELATSAAITVTGTKFVSTSKIYFGSTALTTTYVSSTQLKATLSSTQLATVGTYQIKVTSPTPGGGTTATVPFAVVVGTTSLGAVTSPAPTVTRSATALTVKVTIKNAGSYSARSVVFTGGTLNGIASATVSPTTAVTIAKAGTTVVTLTFPLTAAVTGKTATVVVKYTSQNAGNSSVSATTALVP